MEIQRLASLWRLEPLDSAPAARQQAAPGAAEAFGQVLRDAMLQVENDQRAAQDASVRLVTGQVQDVAEVMIASERANLSLGLAVQVRNRVLEAYQEIMRMPL